MRIKEIKIKNFRGFNKVHPINLHDVGKNAIIYGENGSGKSSLFLALKYFLSAGRKQLSIRDEPNYNLFADQADDIYIKLTLNNGNPPYEWTEANIPQSPEILAGYKYSGFLEYRDILATHYLKPNETQVNLFELLVFTLLADIENPATSPRITFQEHWKNLQEGIPTDNRYKTKINELESNIQKFNEGLNDILEQLQSELKSIFEDFKYDKVTLKFDPVQLVYDQSTKSIKEQKITLNIKFANQNLEGKHTDYLNEAKLSAIGISIYLAALKLNPVQEGDLAILVLDDVLIGLDMSNRLPIIDIIDEHFIDKYQIFIMTYDLEWFETLCDHFVEPNKSMWKAFEFYCADDAELELPIFAERGKGRDEYIKRAEEYYAANDYKAAAVYTRSAYEAILKFFCAKHNVPVPYVSKPKDLKADKLWDAVKSYIATHKKVIDKKTGNKEDYLDSKTISHVEKANRRILNPLSHSRAVPTYRREVQYAIAVVKKLYDRLQ
ncbi:MAG: AAA family ATPase [Aphanizomenon gracile PMC649.10]|nr:AAA family ATPase [Aphanizomenon gracile PMC649.10]